MLARLLRQLNSYAFGSIISSPKGAKEENDIMRRRIALLALLAVLVGAVPAQATVGISVMLPSSNVGITSMNYNVIGTTINIYETWGTVGRGFLEIQGLESGVNYVVNKEIINSTGVDWNRFSNELLDPAGQLEDVMYDPTPQPGWVPTGFSTSNDYDGLSFAQGSPIPRTSNAFSSLLVDEVTDERDFLDFYNGTVSGAGGMDLVSFGLRDNDANANEPFLLAQRPNESSVPEVPEPATLLLLGIGLGAGAFARRRRRS